MNMKNTFFGIAILLCMSLFIETAKAQLDPESNEALRKTQNVLTDQGTRERVKATDASLQKIDKDLENLVGKDGDKEALYQAASKIMSDLAQETNGDADKMQLIMQEAQKNPKAFYEKYISGENKQMIRGIAEDIEKIKVDSKRP